MSGQAQQAQKNPLENAETYAVVAAFVVLIGLLIALLQKNQKTSQKAVAPIPVEQPAVAVKRPVKPKAAAQKKKQKKRAAVAQVENAARGKDEDVDSSMVNFIASVEEAQKASTKKSKKQRQRERKAEQAALAAANSTVTVAEAKDDDSGFQEVKDKAPKKAANKPKQDEDDQGERRGRRPKAFYKTDLLQKDQASADGEKDSPKPVRKRFQKPLPTPPKVSDFAAIPSLEVMINAITASQEKNFARGKAEVKA